MRIAYLIETENRPDLVTVAIQSIFDRDIYAEIHVVATNTPANHEELARSVWSLTHDGHGFPTYPGDVYVHEKGAPGIYGSYRDFVVDNYVESEYVFFMPDYLRITSLSFMPRLALATELKAITIPRLIRENKAYPHAGYFGQAPKNPERMIVRVDSDVQAKEEEIRIAYTKVETGGPVFMAPSHMFDPSSSNDEFLRWDERADLPEENFYSNVYQRGIEVRFVDMCVMKILDVRSFTDKALDWVCDRILDKSNLIP